MMLALFLFYLALVYFRSALIGAATVCVLNLFKLHVSTDDCVAFSVDNNLTFEVSPAVSTVIIPASKVGT